MKFKEKIKKSLKSSFVFDLYKKNLNQIAIDINKNPSKWIFIIWIAWKIWKTSTLKILYELIKFLFSEKDIFFISDLWLNIKWLSINNNKIWIFDIQNYIQQAKKNWKKIVIIEIDNNKISEWLYDWIDFDSIILTNLNYNIEENTITISNIKHLLTWIIRNQKKIKMLSLNTDSKLWREFFNKYPFDKKISISTIWNSILFTNNIKYTIYWTTFDINYLWQNKTIKTNLIWKGNIYNILLTIWTMLEIWIKFDTLVTFFNNKKIFIKDRMDVKIIDNWNIIITNLNYWIKEFINIYKLKKNKYLTIIFDNNFNKVFIENQNLNSIIKNIIIVEKSFKINKKTLVNRIEWKNLFIFSDLEIAKNFAIKNFKNNIIYINKWK